MTSEDLRAICLSLPGAVEEQPFRDVEVTTFKVAGKIFAIQPGYHFNERHWNTVAVDGALPDDMVQSLVEDLYALVAPRRR